MAFKNPVVQPLLTDFYQITMAYAYWKNDRMRDHAVFDLHFRKNPFKGEYTIFAGLSDCISYIQNFRFTEEDIDYIKSVMEESTKPEFFDYLRNLTADDVTLYAQPEGTVVFPKTPLIRVEGPLAVVQLLETTLLNLVNFASLVTTNAARFRKAAGHDKILLEFGLRRAQGPDGGLSASKFCYMGGFDGTSNVLAGKTYGIPVKGTHAHAFVSSFHSGDAPLEQNLLNKGTGVEENFVKAVNHYVKLTSEALKISSSQLNKGELNAFICYASSHPNGLIALVDTYDALKSGTLNFISVALALNDFGYRAKGVRIDSGDLAYISKEIRKIFVDVANAFNVPWFEKLSITASNDINEETLKSLEQQGHEINAYGIGTHLVTCQRQPALGCVFKLVELNGNPRMKLTEDKGKVTVPGKKNLYRLYGADGLALLDLMTKSDEEPPKVKDRVLSRHMVDEAKRAYVKPSTVKDLLTLYWKDGKIVNPVKTLEECRENVRNSLATLRSDHLRGLNPTPYKVSVTNALYQFMHDLWMEYAPISELQ